MYNTMNIKEVMCGFTRKVDPSRCEDLFIVNVQWGSREHVIKRTLYAIYDVTRHSTFSPLHDATEEFLNM
jgi:hypothetical protein